MQIEINTKDHFSDIKQFKFLNDLGIGSFGKVKLAIHNGTHRKYAIKIIDLNNQLNQNQLQIIAREIKVHSKLDHPHIIKLWDTIFYDNKIYMVMDYAKNGSLFKYHSNLLQSGTQPPLSQVYQFFYQTLQALKYLHSNDIMHRDIKPQNLLLDEDLNVKLCDFGWATNQITTSRNTFCGTYEYMAPQMVLQKSYDYRIDIWALGVLLYELVHGRAPFQAQNLKIMKQKINNGSYQINSACAVNLKNLIIDILQFIPQKRLSIKQIQSHPWVQVNQNVGFSKMNGLIDQIINTSQGNYLHTVKKISTNPITKGHKHQKSMGNFMEAGKGNLCNSKTKQQPMLNIIIEGEGHKSSSSLKQDQIKKHKRNATQPNTQIIQRQKSTIKNKKSHAKILLGSLHTQADTPYIDNRTQIKRVIKKKQKCKTQTQQQIIQYEPNINMQYNKNIINFQQYKDIQHNKNNFYTQTGSIINNNNHHDNFMPFFQHGKNKNNVQFKQNHGNYQKTKKKIKIQDKINNKGKKFQDKLIQGDGKTQKIIPANNL